ncbi:hypothetical protein FVB9532_03878 [Mesonia oceanica]|uniref:Uncharacterized protein n=1 Tax=Mesonia oceanica TaxID=2687242 RepID=A0AC61YDL8_9FLAO|nr:hypothetical protein FVB9532_03878 [Mesonia oceanica]
MHTGREPVEVKYTTGRHHRPGAVVNAELIVTVAADIVHPKAVLPFKTDGGRRHLKLWWVAPQNNNGIGVTATVATGPVNGVKVEGYYAVLPVL